MRPGPSQVSLAYNGLGEMNLCLESWYVLSTPSGSICPVSVPSFPGPDPFTKPSLPVQQPFLAYGAYSSEPS
jgi:hypothetical protein